MAMEDRTILQKVDLFFILFLLFIIGVLICDVLPLVVPLRYKILKQELLTIMLTAFVSYLLGKKFAGHKLKIKNKVFPVYKENNIFLLKVLIIFLFFVGLTFYLQNGIPLFGKGNDASSLKGELVSKRTYGNTRIIYVILPYLVTLLYSLKQKVFCGKNSPYSTLFYLLLPFILLFFGLFKGAIVTYICGILIIFDKYQYRIRFSFKTIIYVILFSLIIILPIYLTEINDFSSAVLYVLNRLMIYSWEGFNYIVLYKLGPNALDQFETFLGIRPDIIPGHILASEFFGVNPPPIGLNTTLFGFAYRNGGIPLVVIMFFFLGFSVKKILEEFSNTKNKVTSVTCVFLYIALMKMFLVGEPFRDLRGALLSLLVVHFLSKFVLKLKTR